MDTSTSTAITPTEYVVGERAMLQSIFGANGWLPIVEKEFNRLRPRLKYMHGSKTIRDLITYTIRFSAGRRIRFTADSADLTFCALNLSMDTRVVDICSLPWAQSTDERQYNQILAATLDGELIQISAVYVKLDSSPARYTGDRVAVETTALDKLPLGLMVNEYRSVAGIILDGLYKLAVDTRNEKKKRAAEMEEICAAMESVRARIDMLVEPDFFIGR